jgi:MFS family permease
MTKCNEDDIPGIDIRIHGPFNDLRPHEMERKLRHFMSATSLDDYEHYFRKGMYLAQDPQAFDEQRQDRLFLTEEEKKFLELDKEPTIEEPGAGSRWKLDLGKWNLPWALWRLVALCGLGAMVQGWDEAAVDGAQLSYLAPFGFSDGLITADYRVGLINSAPYLCCVLSCWFTQPLNAKLGRRGTIFVTAIISAAFALAQAFSPTGNWRILFGFRLLMGLGIGPKSATIPIYAAESAPANIRGSLVMMWQVFTAVGIMFGCLSGVVFQNTGPNNWRYMLASPMVAPIILAMYIFTQPESPRWTIAKGHEARDGENASRAKAYYQQAFDALVALRHTKVQASRDLFLIYYLLENEKEEVKAVRMDPNKSWYQKGVFELFTKRRNRRALTANLICMFAQQFW